MNSATCITSGDAITASLGQRLGMLTAPGDVLLLSGELGAGKTCLIRGIATGLGVSEYAFSPSFVLIREYRGRLSLFHMDFYRLEETQEALELGLEDYLYGEGVCAIEWADRVAGLLPSANLSIKLSYMPDIIDSRIITFTAAGMRHRFLLEQLVNTTRDTTVWN